MPTIIRLAAALLLVAAGSGRLTWAASQDPGQAAAVDRQPRRTFLLIHAADLEPAARAWAAYRRSRRWSVHLEPVAAAAGAGEREQRRRWVQERIRDRHQRHLARGGGDFAVLLLGDAGGRGIPTWSHHQADPLLRAMGGPNGRTYASDHAYQCLTGTSWPQIPLGRVPATTMDEALVVLDKVRRYETAAPPGPWRRRVNYAAGEGHFGPLDTVLEMSFRLLVERFVPADCDLSMTYAKPTSMFCPPPDQATETILQRLGEGALLFNYVGHGAADRLDDLRWGRRRRPLLTREDVGRLDGDPSRMPVALLTCCSTGWFDRPGGEHCLAESMLFHPTGPVAVIAGSRPTHPYANALLQMDVTRSLLVDRAPTIGDVDLDAARSMLRIDAADRSLDALVTMAAAAASDRIDMAGLRRSHVALYNLLGDPAMEIAHPAGRIMELELVRDRVRGLVPGMAQGTVRITIERAAASLPPADRLEAVVDRADPDLPRKAARNYPLANDRVLLRLDAPIRDGRFDVALPQPRPAGAAVLKAYAVGANAHGAPADAAGARRLLKRRIERRATRRPRGGQSPGGDSPR
jgi:hypothetical protein